MLEATGTVSGSWSTGVRNTAAVGWNFISPTQPVTVEVAHAYASAQTLTATEILDMANAGLTGLAGETCSARLARYAAWSGIPSTDTAFDTGESVLTAIDTAGASPVESMRKVAAADQGVLFDARDGTLTFKSRAARPIATSALTLDLSTHIVQDDFNPKLDRSALVNDCTVTAEGQQIRYFDATSRDDYGPHTLSLELATTSAHANSIASWIVNVNKTPAVRVPSLSIDPLPLSSGSWNSLLGITIGSVVTVTNQPTQMASTSNVYFVEGYSEKYGPESVTFTFNVSPAEATLSTFVIEGGTPRGQLDSSAILAQ